MERTETQSATNSSEGGGRTNNDTDTRNSNGNEGTDSKNLISELLYCFASFQAIVTPVSITMILSALAVVYLNTDETRAQGEAAFSQTYEVIELEEGNSSQNIAASLINVLIIVTVICFLTFVIVILYKYGCIKIFLGYMILVTSLLLSYFTSNMALVAIEIYDLSIDKFSFAYLVWNYSLVGVAAIFFNKGIPKFVTQGYLVTSSVVLAWQLSYFNEWTAWTLLVMLAFYDLFAVLSPCGPLKALTQLMSRPGAQPLPGLLYEASLPTGVQRPTAPNQQTGQESQDGDHARNSISSSDREQQRRQRPEKDRNAEADETNTSSTRDEIPPDISQERPPATFFDRHREARSEIQPTFDTQIQLPKTTSQESVELSLSTVSRPRNSTSNNLIESNQQRTSKTALAIAKLYKLQVIDEKGVLKRRGQPLQREYTKEEVRAIDWTAKQLRTEVTVVLPVRGGRIEKSEDQSSRQGTKYEVYNRSGELLRTFVVNRQGIVLQVVRRSGDDEESKKDNSIKLGLGDFIFYSVLVSKAALYSFTSFAACMLTILFGLGATLVLLAVHGKALPALPISIFLAVIIFVTTRFFGEPFIQEILRAPFYV